MTVNGVPFIQAPSNIGLEEEDEDCKTKYVYDVYWFDEETPDLNKVLTEEQYREVRDDDYSSNDEDNPANDYPDEEDPDYNYYGDYDETQEMLREFETHCIHDSDSDSEAWAEAES